MPSTLDFDRVKIDADGSSSKLDLNNLKAEIQTPSFMSERKLIIVKNSGLFTISAAKGSAGGAAKAGSVNASKESADSVNKDSNDSGSGGSSGTHKDRQQVLQNLLDLLNDRVCLVFIEQKVDKRLKSLLAAVQDKGVIAEMALENPKILKQWIEAECRQRGIKISSEAAESMVDRCDHSMRVIWSEMEKMFLYLEYKGQTEVDLETVKLIGLPDLRGNIFDLTDAISNGQTENALILLDTLIRQKQPVQLIQFMFARHFRQLICAAETGKSNELISQLKVMPFVANRLIKQAKQFSLPVMERIYELCFESDLMVKTGKMTDRLVLETLMVRAGEAAKMSRHH